MNIRINYVHFGEHAIIIGWSANVGFGQLTAYTDENQEKYCVDTEGMSEKFIKEVWEKALIYMLNNPGLV